MRGANVRDRWLKDYELIFIAWCGGLGFVWTFVAFWIFTSWEPALSTPDLAGVIRGVMLWPAWLTLFTGMLFYQMEITTYFAWLPSMLLFLLIGVALVAHMRR